MRFHLFIYYCLFRSDSSLTVSTCALWSQKLPGYPLIIITSTQARTDNFYKHASVPLMDDNNDAMGTPRTTYTPTFRAQNGRMVADRIFRAHTHHVLGIAAGPNETFLTCSADCSVKKWDIKSGGHGTFKKYQTKGEGSYLLCIFVHNGAVFCGSQDRSVLEYSIVSGEFVRSFQGHGNHVKAVHARGKYLYSGYYRKAGSLPLALLLALSPSLTHGPSPIT